MKIRFLALCTALGLSQVAIAQQGQNVPALLSIVGAPFSADRTSQGGRNFVDGNRIDRGAVVHLYRDGQGRTRVEREATPEALAANPRRDAGQVIINDPVSGDRIELHPRTKTAVIYRGRSTRALPPQVNAPAVFVTFGGRLYDAMDQGWSKPVSLGQKSFDGLPATGQRRQYTFPIGAIGNEKPVLLTVDQWFSPGLSLIIAKSGSSSLGGEFSSQVENIVRGEPSASLFLIPSDYSRIEAPQRQAAVH